jgi:hypothetical protein
VTRLTGVVTAPVLPDTPPLPRPYDTPPAPGALRPTPATLGLVRTQVHALLTSSPAYHALHLEERRRLSDNLVKIAAYSAELIRDDWHQSARLGQRPVLRRRTVIEGPVATQASADPATDSTALDSTALSARPSSSARPAATALEEGSGFQPAAANQVGRVTRETLNAIAFPTFVADLIKGTFNAIVNASIQQMEAYMKLLENVSKTVDQFMRDNISDDQAKDWLAQMYPQHITVRGGQAVPRDGADDAPAPDFRSDLGLSEEVSLDESSINEQLVPAARRRLAQTRHQMLSTMVLLGMNRIVVTGGKIRATMGFHIDARDRAHSEHATDFDFRAAASGSFGFGPWSVSASTSVAYVTSSRRTSDAELNVEADLTGEVEIHFKTDYFPLERFAGPSTIGTIRSHTPVPEANTPPASASGPFEQAPEVGGTVGRFQSPRTQRTTPPQPQYRPAGSPLPEARMPVAPTPPNVTRRAGEETAGGDTGGTHAGGETTSGGGTTPSGGNAPGGEGSSGGGGETGGTTSDSGSAGSGETSSSTPSPPSGSEGESTAGSSGSSTGGSSGGSSGGAGDTVRNAVGGVVGQVGNAAAGAAGDAVGGLIRGAVGRLQQPRR